MNLFLALTLALLVSTLVLAVLVCLAPRAGLMDHPGERRRLHRESVPRVGGLAVFAGLLASLVVGPALTAAHPVQVYHISLFHQWMFFRMQQRNGPAEQYPGAAQQRKGMPESVQFQQQLGIGLSVFFFQPFAVAVYPRNSFGNRPEHQHIRFGSGRQQGSVQAEAGHGGASG